MGLAFNRDGFGVLHGVLFVKMENACPRRSAHRQALYAMPVLF
jgi:hypothetical protein